MRQVGFVDGEAELCERSFERGGCDFPAGFDGDGEEVFCLKRFGGLCGAANVTPTVVAVVGLVRGGLWGAETAIIPAAAAFGAAAFGT